MNSLAIASASLAVGFFVLRKCREYQWGWYRGKGSMDGKIVIVTGANSGIGRETTNDLVRRGATVILACRNKGAAQDAVKDIRSSTPDGEMIIIELDLSSLSSVRRFAKSILQKFTHIDVLVNNAGIYVPPMFDRKTNDGFEIHYGINHLGHFLLTLLLLERIKETPHSRIINVSSSLYRQGRINFEQGVRSAARKGMNPLYNDSKLANILHARELANRLKDTTTSVFVLCPGFTFTHLFRHAISISSFVKKICFLPVAYFFMRSSKQGAQTSIMCCVEQSLIDVSFGFFKNCQEEQLQPIALNDETAAKLWLQSEEQCSEKKDN